MNMEARYNYRKLLGYLMFALLVFSFDQFSKQLAYANLLAQPPYEILSFLQFTLVFNRGAAFGFLAEAGGWQHYFFAGLAAIVAALVVFGLWQAHQRNATLAWGLALVLGGALGNLLDRVRYQYVIDFILLHYQDWYFPVFNVADIAISCGAILLLLDALGWRIGAGRG